MEFLSFLKTTPSSSQNYVVSRHCYLLLMKVQGGSRGGWFQPLTGPSSICVTLNPSYSDTLKLPMASIIPLVAQEMDEELEQMWAESLRGITTIDPGEWKIPGPDNFVKCVSWQRLHHSRFYTYWVGYVDCRQIFFATEIKSDARVGDIVDFYGLTLLYCLLSNWILKM
jgi:hypothetical protein